MVACLCNEMHSAPKQNRDYDYVQEFLIEEIKLHGNMLVYHFINLKVFVLLTITTPVLEIVLCLFSPGPGTYKQTFSN